MSATYGSDCVFAAPPPDLGSRAGPELSPPAAVSIQSADPLMSRTLEASELPARASRFPNNLGAIARENIGLIAGFTVCGIVLILLGTLTDPFRKLKWKGWFSLVLTVVLVCLLAIEILPTHVLFGTILGILIIFECVTPEDSLRGFGNTGVATVCILFIVAAGVTRTNTLATFFRYILGNKPPRDLRIALLKLCIPLGGLSAFLNNTPIYVMAVPVIMRWCRKVGIAPSKVLMPVSISIILGGTISVIGTSTNLVVSGLAEADKTLLDLNGKRMKFDFFGISKVGLVYFGVGILYVLIFAGFEWALPSRKLPEDKDKDVETGKDSSLQPDYKTFLVSMKVGPNAISVIGKSIEEAGLANLHRLILAEVQRADSGDVQSSNLQGKIFPAPSDDFVLEKDDVLVFTGALDAVVEIFNAEPGLVALNEDGDSGFNEDRHFHVMYEAVISPKSQFLLGRRIRDIPFQEIFGAVVVGVSHPGGVLIQHTKLGELTLNVGNTLLLEATPIFYKRHANDINFSVVVPVEDFIPPRSDWLHMAYAASIALAMVAIAAADILPGKGGIFVTCIAAGFLMIASGCMTLGDASIAIEVGVMLTIAFAFGVGRALEKTGVGEALANVVIDWLKPYGPMGIVAAIYFSVALLTEIITNNGCVAIMYPVVAGLIKSGRVPGLSPYAACYALMLGGSASFMTPIGYQLNLLAHAKGGYKFSDWPRFGAPLQMILGVIGVVCCHYFYQDA